LPTPAWVSLACLVLALMAALVSGLMGPAIDLVALPTRLKTLLAWQLEHPWLFGLCFFALFTLLAATALPGCSVLALAAGACFGWAGGTLLVVGASTLGATLTFLAARHVLREPVQRRWGHRLAALEAALARNGARYLFTLRLAPVVPYALLNLLMGLSRMSTRTFFAVSALGMLAGSAVYAHAGTLLARTGSVQALWSAEVLGALALLALLPWAGRLWARAGSR
jgi:uncharacterized membrane protein YdjX (TVP38/TMEM64 family)